MAADPEVLRCLRRVEKRLNAVAAALSRLFAAFCCSCLLAGDLRFHSAVGSVPAEKRARNNNRDARPEGASELGVDPKV